MIAEDGVLADTKLIAEPWDAAGLYQVGGFPVRPALVRVERPLPRRRAPLLARRRRAWPAALATRLCGSADLYERHGRLPRHSINFVTCHDGFTLSDLVRYNHKHNEANGEGNRDGTDENCELELRRRGADRRPRGPRPAAAAGHAT